VICRFAATAYMSYSVLEINFVKLSF